MTRHSRWLAQRASAAAAIAEAELEISRRELTSTVVTLFCGMVPMALALGSGSQMLRQLAIAVIGGLLLSVVLSLIVTPALYFLLTAGYNAASPARA